MDESETAKKILGLIAEARQYSNPYNASQLFRISEELMALLVFLVKPLMESETAFRGEIQRLLVNSSVAAAEAVAKAGENYAKWQSLKRVYELADSQIKLCKKFAGLLSDELKRI